MKRENTWSCLLCTNSCTVTLSMEISGPGLHAWIVAMPSRVRRGAILFWRVCVSKCVCACVCVCLRSTQNKNESLRTTMFKRICIAFTGVEPERVWGYELSLWWGTWTPKRVFSMTAVDNTHVLICPSHVGLWWRVSVGGHDAWITEETVSLCAYTHTHTHWCQWQMLITIQRSWGPLC